mgnify:CR=1
MDTLIISDSLSDNDSSDAGSSLTVRKHLSHDAGLILLAVVPEYICDAYVIHAKQIY